MEVLSLSREEQAKLIRSNKKVKDVTHADFRDGQALLPSSPRFGNEPLSQASSFKDKLIGEIPGAFTQAFNFGELMEEEVDSDKEVEVLREGLAAMRFSKDLKQEIQKPWGRALIVKVFGRSVGFNILHSKLLSLWKPAGILDCVVLGYGFFLTQLSLKEAMRLF